MPRIRRGLPSFVVALLVLLCAPPGAAAQEPPAITGRVRDIRTGAPVEGVLIAIPRLRVTARSDSGGTFVLRGVPAGTYQWSVARLGYVPLNQEVELGPGDSFTVGIMPRPLMLEGLTARVQRAERLLRRRRGSAAVSVRALGPEELISSGAPSAASLVRLHVPVHPCTRGTGSLDGLDCVWHRGSSVPVRVFVDEIPAHALSDLLTYRPAELYSVELWGGTEVRVYTTRFAERLARGRERLLPRGR